MTLNTNETTKQNTQDSATVLDFLADSVAPLLKIGEGSEGCGNTWLLWLDFLLEVQSKLMVANTADRESSPDDSFAFRCSENFGALRQVFRTLANNKVDPQLLQKLKSGLDELRKKLDEIEKEL